MFPKQAYYFLNGNIMVDRIMETLCKESFASHSAAIQQNPQRCNTAKPTALQYSKTHSAETRENRECHNTLPVFF